MVNFADLIISGVSEDINLTVSCTNQADFMASTTFAVQVHAYPETGLLKQSDVQFSYNGNQELVADLLNALAASMASQESTRKKRSVVSSSTLVFAKNLKHNWPEF